MISKRNYYALGLLGICLCWAMACVQAPKNRIWFTCNTTIDTTLVMEDWERGAYLINDSLVLTTGCKPLDENFCTTIELRIGRGGVHGCSLGDLFPPFKLYKPNNSDTLIVIKNGTVIYFEIPESHCKHGP